MRNPQNGHVILKNARNRLLLVGIIRPREINTTSILHVRREMALAQRWGWAMRLPLEAAWGWLLPTQWARAFRSVMVSANPLVTE
ncbi:hypothetical protein IT571_03220 [Candidatus Sumerlaeota bacterium]|nr:hypothetical protein [Candidatus Sumerlaeota bacterium]